MTRFDLLEATRMSLSDVRCNLNHFGNFCCEFGKIINYELFKLGE